MCTYIALKHPFVLHVQLTWIIFFDNIICIEYNIVREGKLLILLHSPLLVHTIFQTVILRTLYPYVCSISSVDYNIYSGAQKKVAICAIV